MSCRLWAGAGDDPAGKSLQLQEQIWDLLLPELLASTQGWGWPGDGQGSLGIQHVGTVTLSVTFACVHYKQEALGMEQGTKIVTDL